MKRTLYAAGTALCLLLLLTVIVCAVAARMGRDGELYARCFHAFARDTGRFGVSDAQFDAVGRDLAAYFSGSDVAFPYFNEKERTHLADIRSLFSLLDRAWLLLIPAAALAIPLARKPDPKGFLWGLGLAVLLPGAAAAYTTLHFEAAFIALHRLLFANNLWLLNPNTDLLICLMPEPMFTFLAGRLATIVIPAWLLIPTLCILGAKIQWSKSRCAR